MSTKPLQTLHQSLLRNNFDVPEDYSIFERALTAKGKEGVKNRQLLYKSLRDNNFDVPQDYRSFANTLFAPAKKVDTDKRKQTKQSNKSGSTKAQTNSLAQLSGYATHPNRRVVNTEPEAKQNFKPTMPMGRIGEPLPDLPSGIPSPFKPIEDPNAYGEHIRDWSEIKQEQDERMRGIDNIRQQADEGLERANEAVRNVANLNNLYASQNMLELDGVDRGALGDNPNVHRGDLTYDQSKGKFVRKYVDTAGNTYDYKAQANDEQDRMDAIARIKQHPEEHTREQLDRLNENVTKAYDNYRRYKQSAFTYSPYYGGGVGMSSSAKNDLEWQTLSTAKYALDDAYKTIREAETAAKTDKFFEWMDSNWAGSAVKGALEFTGGAARGAMDKLFDVRTWLDSATVNEQRAIEAALDAADKGTLTKEQKMLLDAEAMKLSVDAVFGSQVGYGYTAGGIAAESLPFMLEFAINPASAAGKTIGARVARYALKKLGKGVLNRVMKMATKIGARTAGNIAAAAAMTSTTSMPRVLTGAQQRQNGDIKYANDANNNIVYGGHTQGDNTLTAYGKSYLDAFIDNFTEMGGSAFSKEAKVATKTGRMLTKMDRFVNLVEDFEKRTQWHGPIEEYLEEVAANIMNAATVGDMTFDTAKDTGVFNPKLNLQTFAGVAITGGIISGMKTAGYRSPKKRAAAAMKEADDGALQVFGNGTKWRSIRNSIAFGSDEDAVDTLSKLCSDKNTTPQQRAAALEYAKSALYYKGVLKGEAERATDTKARMLDEAYGTGYKMKDVSNMRTAKLRLDTSRNRLSEFVADDKMRQFDSEPLIALHTIKDNEQWSQEEKQDAIDYVNAKAVYDGMIQAVRDDINSQIAASDEIIDNRIASEEVGGDGMIHPATLKRDERKVYVLSGNVVLTDDGDIDYNNSDKDLIVADAKTGEREFVDLDSLKDAGEAINPEAEKQTASEAIRESVSQTASDMIDGKLAFTPNEEIVVMGEDGTEHVVHVIGDVDKDNVAVTMDADEKPVTMPIERLQAMYDTNRANEQKQILEQQRSDPYTINADVVINTNEGGVSGVVISPENEDGLIEVETDTPINGKKVNLFTRDELDELTRKEQGDENTSVEVDSENSDTNQTNNQENADDVLVERLSNHTPERAQGFINNNIESLNKELAKAKKKTSKATDIDQYERETAENEAEVKRLEAELERWNTIQQRVNDIANEKKAAARAEQLEKDKQLHDEAVKAEGQRIEEEQQQASAEAREQHEQSVANTQEDSSEEVSNSNESNEGDGLIDNQGNPINEDGTLKVEKVSSIDEITDEDFSAPTRNVELPTLPKNVDDAIGAKGKPVIIKKNIFEKNKISHGDLTAKQSREILQSALFNPQLYGQNQKAKKPYNWVVINTKDEVGHNRIVLLEINNNKDNVEIIHWHYVRDNALESIKRQAQREGGRILILPSDNSEEAGGLSSRTSSLSSADKDKTSSANEQEKGGKTYDFTNETEDEWREFEKGAKDMSDEELLDVIRAQGFDETKASHMSVYDEYDARHKEEYGSLFDTYMDGLNDGSVGKDEVEDMLADAERDWRDGGFGSDMRTHLMAQIDACREWLDGHQYGSFESQLPADGVANENVATPTKVDAKKKEFDIEGVRLHKLKSGETCHVERRYVENGGFSFVGGEKIESMDDVAYIFKQLENAAIENSFIALIKNGKATVIHVGTGAYAATIANVDQAFAAYKELKPEKVYFIHNHPSGALRASRQDAEILDVAKSIFGDAMQPGIIIDTTSGKYGVYDQNGTSREQAMLDGVGNEIPIKTYSFSKQVFSDDWNPDKEMRIINPESIAAFVSSHRLGQHKKMSFLVLNQQNGVTANLFLPYTKLSEAKPRVLADMLSKYVHLAGGVKGVLYGNYELDEPSKPVMETLSFHMRKLKTPLLDVIHINRSANEEGRLREPEVKYHKASEGVPVYYSNAQRAVEGIKQEKATPEQWLKMIEKAGGLKAGEDKWLGLSDYLKSEHDKKTLTKDEVLDFIRENMIQIEEMEYEDVDFDAAFADYKAEYKQYYDEAIANGANNGSAQTEAWDRMIGAHGDDFNLGFYADGDKLRWDEESDYVHWEAENKGQSKPINSTRLDYTTEGLNNKREIALVVPTIESWNEDDEIHFGDAGEGRAVAWVRFGDTTDEDGNKVLVIDEIQSKRHQEGREEGYMGKDRQIKIDRYEELESKSYSEEGLTDEEYSEMKALEEEGVAENKSGVPAAPFEKNWMELAMKRMLRYAAENGYDKVAWTTGEQQAERYNIGGIVPYIDVEVNPDNSDFYRDMRFSGCRVAANEEGKITLAEGLGEDAVGKSLGEVFGKEVAIEIMGADKAKRIQLEGKRVGGEGMKGFYDKMLPSFMNKNGKKWGVKVGEVTLPNVEESARKMWSVDVTPEMKESVMQGQPMFLRGGAVQLTPQEVALRDAIVDLMDSYGLRVITDDVMGQSVIDKVNGGARLQKRLGALAKASDTIKRWLSNDTRGKVFTIELPVATLDKIRRAMGRDFSSHNITANGVVHGLLNHGENGNKLTENSIPVRKEDAALIPYIMTAPDDVIKGSTDITGRESIRFYKNLSNGYVVVVEKEYKNNPNDMETINIWAELSPSAATNARKNAPDTHVRNAILSTEDAAKIRKDAETAIENDEKNHEMRVYHGSAADFDAFDHSHMGEGEGAQAYGWGSYVTEVEGIGRTYANSMARKPIGARPVLYKGEDYRNADKDGWSDAKKVLFDDIVGNMQSMGRSALVAMGHIRSQRNHLVQLSERGIERSNIQEKAWNDAIEYLNGMTDEQYDKFVNSGEWIGLGEEYRNLKYAINDNRDLGRKGVLLVCEEGAEQAKKNQTLYKDRIAIEEKQLELLKEFNENDFDRADYVPILYTVDVPDEVEATYLDYDKPLTKELLGKIYSGMREYGVDKFETDAKFFAGKGRYVESGKNFYYMLSGSLGSDKAASEFLHSVGITGIKYPAQHRSGGREDGASNYVIFDENDLKITDKVKFFRTPEGEVYGFTYKGDIYIDPRVATAETPIHEYAHLWVGALKKANPKAWETLKKRMEGMSDVMEYVKGLYPELEGDDLLEEVFTHYSGKRGAERLREEQKAQTDAAEGIFNKASVIAMFEKLRGLLKDFWNKARDLFAGKVEGVEDMSGEDFADMMLGDLLGGFKPDGGGDKAKYARERWANSNRTINDNVLYRDGKSIEDVNDRFNEELQKQIDGELPANHIYNIGMPSDILLSTGFPNIPIELSASHLLTKANTAHHPFDIGEMKDLVKALQSPIAVFAYGDKNKSQNAIVEIQHDDKNFVVGIHFNQKRGRAEVSSIRGLYPKDNAEWLNWVNQGKLLYVDKNKIQTLINQQRRNLADVEYLDLDSAAKVIENFENPKISTENFREGDDTPYMDYEEKLKDSRRRGYTKQQLDRSIERHVRLMRERAEETVGKLGIADNVTILEDNTGLEGRKAKAKGWYDTESGKIVVVLGNHGGVSDVVKTILHEGVAHYGLRQLFGENFNTFLDNVYKRGSEEVKQRIDELAKKYDGDIRTATEEYLASLAEDVDFERPDLQSWWGQIKQWFLDMLRSVGLKDYDLTLTDNELRYILWRSYENLAEPNRYNNVFATARDIAKQYELGVGNFAAESMVSEEEQEQRENKILFRDDNFSPRDRQTARDVYNDIVASGRFQFQEAMQDSMLGLKELYKAILGKGTKIEDVAGNENAYLAENRMSSVNAAEQHLYFTQVMSPLLKAVYELVGEDGVARKELTDYMMAKHGLERNRKFAERDARAAENDGKDFKEEYKQNRKRDYAGLTALTGMDDVRDAEAEAQRIVNDYESSHDTTALWQRVKDATQTTLAKLYKGGIFGKKEYDNIRQMFDYYIPLRGWDEKTSDEVYGYLTSRNGFGGSIAKKAKGRSSKADDPIATIAFMADAAIRQANRNLMKQRFLTFVQNNPSDLVSVNKLWLKYDDVSDTWEPVFADIKDTDTAEEVERKVEEFEERMQQLAQSEPDKYKHGKEAANIPYKVVKGNEREHQVLVKRNGETYVLTINGNPRAAQALNGLTNPDVEVNHSLEFFLKGAEWLNRQMSAAYTTRNPDFVVSNFFRDMLYSNCMTWVKESPKYARRFHMNFALVNPTRMLGLYAKWEMGKLDDNDKIEKLFGQFMANGGETGFTNIKDIEGHKKEIAKELKRQGSEVRKAANVIGEALDVVNRSVENTARFAAFITSREMGRSIDRCIYDAKEVSVNFNKKGSGGKMYKTEGQTFVGKAASVISGTGRLGFVFWNAGIQGLTNISRAAKYNKTKAAVGATMMFALGALMPYAAMLMAGGDDDDKNAYYNLPEYVRRSNICINAGGQWITIPLPIEYRAIYGLGELAYGVLSRHERYSDGELAKQMLSQVSQLLPIDFMEGGGGWHAFVPSSIKPVAEVIFNKSWSGLPIYKKSEFNENDPEAKKVYSNTNKYLVAVSKWLNEMGGGDDVSKSELDRLNPAQLEYILRGYFGGYFEMPNKLIKMAETTFGDREFEWKNMLIANRLVKSGDERTEGRKLQEEYYKYQEEYEKTKHDLKGYEEKTDNEDFKRKLGVLKHGERGLKYEVFDNYRPLFDAYHDAKKGVKEDVRREIEKEEMLLQREMVDLMHAIEDDKNPDIDKRVDDMLKREFEYGGIPQKSAGQTIAKRLGGRDTYGNPKSGYAQTYYWLRDYTDLAQDVALQAEEQKAKESGDTDRAKRIAAARREVTSIKKDLAELPFTLDDGTEVTTDDVMKELREVRSKYLEEFGITRKQIKKR